MRRRNQGAKRTNKLAIYLNSLRRCQWDKILQSSRRTETKPIPSVDPCIGRTSTYDLLFELARKKYTKVCKSKSNDLKTAYSLCGNRNPRL